MYHDAALTDPDGRARGLYKAESLSIQGDVHVAMLVPSNILASAGGGPKAPRDKLRTTSTTAQPRAMLDNIVRAGHRC